MSSSRQRTLQPRSPLLPPPSLFSFSRRFRFDTAASFIQHSHRDSPNERGRRATPPPTSKERNNRCRRRPPIQSLFVVSLRSTTSSLAPFFLSPLSPLSRSGRRKRSFGEGRKEEGGGVNNDETTATTRTHLELPHTIITQQYSTSICVCVTEITAGTTTTTTNTTGTTTGTTTSTATSTATKDCFWLLLPAHPTTNYYSPFYTSREGDRSTKPILIEKNHQRRALVVRSWQQSTAKQTRARGRRTHNAQHGDDAMTTGNRDGDGAALRVAFSFL